MKSSAGKNIGNSSQLLSIADLAREAALEESLIRFYESEYPDELPEKILKGDTLFFEISAVEKFKNVHRRHSKSKPSDHSAEIEKESFARVIAVTSGKGGVGKTNVALNLAIEFQRLGKMTLVLDADLGMANIHLLAGIQPKYNLKDIISSDIKVSDLIVEGPEGIGIVPGGAGVLALADSTPVERARMVAALEDMEKAAEVIIIDTGAGMASGVRDFLRAADEILFVLTPDITSLADAYGLLKALHQEKYERQLYSVINMVSTLQQSADVARRFSDCAGQFLGRQVINIGYLLKDSTVGAATVRRTPYTVFDREARVSKNTRNLAIALLKKEQPELKTNSAFKRYMNLLKGERVKRLRGQVQ
jgi:flagellar biosynthesis protein FlhG